MSTTNEDKINQMYDSQLTSTKAQLQTDYEAADADLTAQQEKARKALDRNISLTKVASQKAAVGNEEYYNAAGLSSGARAQARLAQNNRLLSDITTLRAAQEQADAEIERQRALLSKEYASAIQQAQADNDLARAQALYAEAKEADEKLRAQQETAAGLMAQAGDFSRYGELYGLTPEEIAKLSGTYSSGNSSGDGSGGTIDNGGKAEDVVMQMQRELGVSEDGLWGPESQAAARKKWGVTSAADAWDAYQAGGSPYYEQLVETMNSLWFAGKYKEAKDLVNESAGYLTTSEYTTLTYILSTRVER